VAEGEGRPLTEAEAAILDLLVSPDLPGFDALREQAKQLASSVAVSVDARRSISPSTAPTRLPPRSHPAA
jgi:hypothetical protein